MGMIVGRARPHAFEFSHANADFADTGIILEMRHHRICHACRL